MQWYRLDEEMSFLKQNIKLLILFLALSVVAVVTELSFYHDEKPIISFSIIVATGFILIQLLLFKKLVGTIRSRSRDIENKIGIFANSTNRQENVNRNLMLAIEEIINLQKRETAKS